MKKLLPALLLAATACTTTAVPPPLSPLQAVAAAAASARVAVSRRAPLVQAQALLLLTQVDQLLALAAAGDPASPQTLNYLNTAQGLLNQVNGLLLMAG